MCSNASSMSRSVPGSRSAVVRAAVVCNTDKWQTPDLPECDWVRTSSTSSVMSTISRFFRVLTFMRCIGCHRMLRLVGGDVRFVLQRQCNVIEPFEQTMPRKLINLKSTGKPMLVVHSLLLEVDGEVIIVLLLRPFHDLRHLFFGQNHCEKAILKTVVGEDIGKRRCDDHVKTKIGQCPHRMLARGAAAKILPRHQDACCLVARLVKDEVGNPFPILGVSPIIK